MGTLTLMVNYLADAATLVEDQSFGGAFVVLPDGHLMATRALGSEGVLLVDLP